MAAAKKSRELKLTVKSGAQRRSQPVLTPDAYARLLYRYGFSDPKVQQAIREQLRDRREQLLKAAYMESVHDSSSVENYLADQILKNNGQ